MNCFSGVWSFGSIPKGRCRDEGRLRRSMRLNLWDPHPRLQELPACSKERAELTLSGRALIELASAVLGRGVPIRFRAKGSSMVPFIRDGDIVTISPLGALPRHVGDVVAFAHPRTGNLVVHRILAERAEGWLIRGDDCGAPDGMISRTSLLGRVTAVERNGKAVRYMPSPERYLIGAPRAMRRLFSLMRSTWRRARRIQPNSIHV